MLNALNRKTYITNNLLKQELKVWQFFMLSKMTVLKQIKRKNLKRTAKALPSQ